MGPSRADTGDWSKRTGFTPSNDREPRFRDRDGDDDRRPPREDLGPSRADEVRAHRAPHATPAAHHARGLSCRRLCGSRGTGAGLPPLEQTHHWGRQGSAASLWARAWNRAVASERHHQLLHVARSLRTSRHHSSDHSFTHRCFLSLFQARDWKTDKKFVPTEPPRRDDRDRRDDRPRDDMGPSRADEARQFCACRSSFVVLTFLPSLGRYFL